MEIPIAETVSLNSLGLDEAWLQEQIWDNPACLGLGDLEGVHKEHGVSSGGRLDILLKDPADQSMYEVEVMLGETDANHIVRTIEYWDLTKRKWPQRQHFAVLIAERITQRFFNVIQILSGSVPMIAIQVNVIKSPSGHLLHFTKILDVYEEPDDETSQDGDNYDEAYWKKKSPELLSVAQSVLVATQDVYAKPRLSFCKYSINVVVNGYNHMTVRPRSGGNVLLDFRYGSKRTEIAEILDSCSLQYTEKYKRFFVQLPSERIQAESELLKKIAQQNNGWWTNAGEIG